MIKRSSLPAVADTSGSEDTKISAFAVREELRRHRSTAARSSSATARRYTIAGHAVSFIHNTEKGVNEISVICGV